MNQALLGLACFAFVAGILAATRLAVYIFLDRPLDAAVKRQAQTPPPLPIRGEVHIRSVEDLYAHAGLSEEEEWAVRLDIARARARLDAVARQSGPLPSSVLAGVYKPGRAA